MYPRAEWRNCSSVFIFNFEQISHLVLVLLLLTLSMYLIARFDIVYSLLERISANWNAHPIASLSKQHLFITNFNANSNVNFFYLLINEINSYLLTRSISTTCQNSNSSPWPNSFLNIHICKFKRSNISGRKIPFGKYMSLGLLWHNIHIMHNKLSHGFFSNNKALLPSAYWASQPIRIFFPHKHKASK